MDKELLDVLVRLSLFIITIFLIIEAILGNETANYLLLVALFLAIGIGTLSDNQPKED